MTNILSNLFGDPAAEVSEAYPLNSSVRLLRILILIDRSGSMSGLENETYTAITDLLSALAKKNRTSEDIEYRVSLAFFNDSVDHAVPVPLKPEDLLEVLDRNQFCCTGGTDLTGAVAFLDKQFSRTSPLMTDLHTADPKTFCLILTDMAGTDNNESRKNAIHKIQKNRFYTKANQTLCIFSGSDANKGEAAILAGGEQNVIALDSDIIQYLAPILLEGTISMTDATHTSDEEGELTIAEKAAKIKEKTAEGNASAAQLSARSQDICKEIEDLLKGK